MTTSLTELAIAAYEEARADEVAAKAERRRAYKALATLLVSTRKLLTSTFGGGIAWEFYDANFSSVYATADGVVLEIWTTGSIFYINQHQSTNSGSRKVKVTCLADIGRILARSVAYERPRWRKSPVVSVVVTKTPVFEVPKLSERDIKVDCPSKHPGVPCDLYLSGAGHQHFRCRSRDRASKERRRGLEPGSITPRRLKEPRAKPKENLGEVVRVATERARRRHT